VYYNRVSLLYQNHHRTTTVLRPFFRDHPGQPVPEENFWTLWCKGRLTEADTTTIRLGATPSGLTSAHFHHPRFFLQARCPSCRPTNSVKALKATSAFGLARRYYSCMAWIDNIKSWTRLSVEESIRMTEDRDKWRKYVHGVAKHRIEDG